MTKDVGIRVKLHTKKHVLLLFFWLWYSTLVFFLWLTQISLKEGYVPSKKDQLAQVRKSNILDTPSKAAAPKSNILDTPSKAAGRHSHQETPASATSNGAAEAPAPVTHAVSAPAPAPAGPALPPVSNSHGSEKKKNCFYFLLDMFLHFMIHEVKTTSFVLLVSKEASCLTYDGTFYR